jgi:fumarylacetoacetate (FAA) hydrolase family protein
MIADLPADWREARMIGRLLMPDGPTPMLIENGCAFDLSHLAPTVSELLSDMTLIDATKGVNLGPLCEIEIVTAVSGGEGNRLLPPIDLQVIKASGVTFAVSAIERVIEERAHGDPAAANSIRSGLGARIGSDIRAVRPGSPDAILLKEALIADGMWSQYLEVAIGPDAEIFTKAPVLSAVGWGDYVGIRSDSHWNNPEPEIVLIVDPKGDIIGATLGNDVNLRDIEGRSALLLGKAKDNNASCALGPFIRLFDNHFTIDDVRSAVVDLEIAGTDGFTLTGQSTMRDISRDPFDLVAQAMGASHQYPDGFALFLGTMFAPVKDRDVLGQGFTHKAGDVVRISSAKLGTLENTVISCEIAPPWTFGIASLFRNLAARGLLRHETINRRQFS